MTTSLAAPDMPTSAPARRRLDALDHLADFALDLRFGQLGV